MVNRRLSRVSTSDDEEEPLEPRPQRRRKRMRLMDDDNDNEDEKEQSQEPPQQVEDAKPIGEPVRFSGKGRGRKKHYECFEFDGVQYSLEDPVLLVPEEKGQKPYVAIIKDIITQGSNGNVTVTGQWFYRPEEAEKKGGGNWKSCDTRELFYSFHRDNVPAEAVMHKCVVHFVPLHKQLPKRKDHPGFIVQKVYDTVERKLWRLSDKDYEDVKQREIDELVQKTLKLVGELLDIEPEEAPADDEDQLKVRKRLRRMSLPSLDVSKVEDGTLESGQLSKPETSASFAPNASEYYRILVKFNALTGDSHRDKWLERLLQHMRYMCDSNYGKESVNGLGNSNAGEIEGGSKKGQKSSESFIWPDAVVSAVVALEKASYEALSSDSMKYNQKLRQLAFNLQKNAVLARHLLNGELEPSKILNMTPNELKEGLLADKRTKERDETQHLQMTDARCSKCMNCKVGLKDIIKAGHNERYQLECVSCGHTWYASRDEVSMPTIDALNSKGNIGPAP
ncbi:hypothetical protein Fmac_011685 [Flemingia macrophylla]|uniref:Uncharacterized protein n=1 Tax=Flemingia macrophylla TaxID=520843 RepID=A0ABD1MN57_9FABA